MDRLNPKLVRMIGFGYFGGMNVDIPTPLIDELVRPLILVGNGVYDTALPAKFAPLGPVVAVDGGYAELRASP